MDRQWKKFNFWVSCILVCQLTFSRESATTFLAWHMLNFLQISEWCRVFIFHLSVFRQCQNPQIVVWGHGVCWVRSGTVFLSDLWYTTVFLRYRFSLSLFCLQKYPQKFTKNGLLYWKCNLCCFDQLASIVLIKVFPYQKDSPLNCWNPYHTLLFPHKKSPESVFVYEMQYITVKVAK